MAYSAILQNSRPELRHRGSVDTASAEFGFSMYNLFYSDLLVNLGSVLMFEVKRIETGDPVLPENVTLSFISMENATNTGIANQWQLAVPSLASNNPNVNVKIAIRVYFGDKENSKVAVTEWSNELTLYNPPSQPSIQIAFYDSVSVDNKDDLIVFLNNNENINYEDPNLKIVAAFYYQSGDTNDTVWEVSTPLEPRLVEYGSYEGTYMVRVPNFGDVSDNQSNNPSYRKVYVSVYAVYEFCDDNEKFYSVSQISETIEANPVFENNAPILPEINYAVYDDFNNQNITFTWVEPPVSSIPGYIVANYQVSFSVNGGESYEDIGGLLAYDVDSFTFNASEYPCGTVFNFQVTAISTFGTFSPPSAQNVYSTMKVFRHASAVKNLQITNTDLVIDENDDNLISFDISFKKPDNVGCGDPKRFEIKVVSYDEVNTVLFTDYVTYNNAADDYTYQLRNKVLELTGLVKVRLLTEDTNPSAPGGINYDEIGGSTNTIPYAAVPFTLNPVIYSVYDAPVGTQNMKIEWYDPVSELAGNWVVDNYNVKYQVKTPENTGLDIDDWIDAPDGEIPAGEELVLKSYTFDASDISCNNTVYFKVVANLTNIENGTTYNFEVSSNDVSQNIFKFAQAPTNLVITQTSFNSVTGMAGLTVEFDGPTNEGCGNPIEFKVIIDGVSNTVAYDELGASYSVPYILDVGKSGLVEVYLITGDTNSSDNKNGASVTTPYIATDLVLNSVNYQVYVAPVGSQDMNLSWNDQVAGDWVLATNGYKVFYKYKYGLGAYSSDIEYVATGNTNSVFNAATNDVAECGNTISFYVQATLTNGGVNYVATSNQQEINIFKFAQAPTNLVIKRTSFNSVTEMAGLTVEFDGPTDEGCGAPKEFKVIVDGVSNTVPHTTPGASYSVSYTLDVGKSGLVEVYLITVDTNSLDNKNGASVTTPYIATDLVLNSVNYQVYVAPVGSQNMVLTWNDQVVGAGDWVLATNGYKVFYKYKYGVGEYSSDVEYVATGNTNSVFNAATNDVAECGNTISFYVQATLTNGGVNYVATSNQQEINIFKFASVPTNVRVLWSSAVANYSTMDMRVLFKNPLDSGCGVIKHLVINVLDNNNELITGATKNITYVEGTADYLVNFDNINIPPSKDGYIQVYMVNYDTNDTESELNGAAQLAAYTADRLPIIRNVVMNEDRTLLNCEVITATQLVLSNYIATFNGVITAKYLWTSDNNTPGVAVTTETLENGEYKYVVSINTTIQNCPIPSPLPNPSIIVISNTGAGITYDNVDA